MAHIMQFISLFPFTLEAILHEDIELHSLPDREEESHQGTLPVWDTPSNANPTSDISFHVHSSQVAIHIVPPSLLLNDILLPMTRIRNEQQVTFQLPAHNRSRAYRLVETSEAGSTQTLIVTRGYILWLNGHQLELVGGKIMHQSMNLYYLKMGASYQMSIRVTVEKPITVGGLGFFHPEV
jgi:hypothetical protein